MSVTLLAKADTPAPGAETQAELTSANNIAIARYGAAVASPDGKVEGFNNLLPLVLAMQPKAYETLATTIAGGAPPKVDGEKILITSRTNVAALILSARQVQQDVKRILDEGKLIIGSPPDNAIFGGPLTIPAIMSIAGGVDSLVGLFRTNYSFAGGDTEANELGLRLAVQRALKKGGHDAVIDGLDLVPGDTAGFNDLLIELAKLRYQVAGKKPATGSREANFVAASDTVLSSLRTANNDGVTPAAKLIALLNLDEQIGMVTYVGIVKPSAIAVSTKRLFSLNAKVHLVLTGLINVVYQRKNGAVISSATLTLGEQATLNLRDLEKSKGTMLKIETSPSM